MADTVDIVLCGLRDVDEIKIAAQNLRQQLLDCKAKYGSTTFFQRGVAQYQTLLWVLGAQNKQCYPEVLESDKQLSDMMGGY
jgi:hypothetical protein